MDYFLFWIRVLKHVTFCSCTPLAPVQSFHSFSKLSWWPHFWLCILVGCMPFSTLQTCHILLAIHSTYWFLFSKFITIYLFWAVDYFLLSGELCTGMYRMSSSHFTLHSDFKLVLSSAYCTTSQPGVSCGFISISSKSITILKCMRNFVWYKLTVW